MSFADLVAQTDDAVRAHLGPTAVRYESASHGLVTPDPVGMFDENFRLEDESRSGIETVTPAVWLKLADLPVHPNDDDPVLTINGKRYTVRQRSTDGEVGGSVLLFLHRAE